MSKPPCDWFFNDITTFSLSLSKMEGSAESLVHAPKAASVKALLESSGSASIPCAYSYSTLHLSDHNTASEPEETIPIIDFSLLTSCDPHQRSIAIHKLSKACEEWGFFTVINIQIYVHIHR